MYQKDYLLKEIETFIRRLIELLQLSRQGRRNEVIAQIEEEWKQRFNFSPLVFIATDPEITVDELIAEMQQRETLYQLKAVEYFVGLICLYADNYIGIEMEKTQLKLKILAIRLLEQIQEKWPAIISINRIAQLQQLHNEVKYYIHK
jgi:hypothetical protein